MLASMTKGHLQTYAFIKEKKTVKMKSRKPFSFLFKRIKKKKTEDGSMVIVDQNQRFLAIERSSSVSFFFLIQGKGKKEIHDVKEN